MTSSNTPSIAEIARPMTIEEQAREMLQAGFDQQGGGLIVGHVPGRDRVFLDILTTALTRIEKLEAALFVPKGSDASLNLQSALDDLRGEFNPKDGDVIARTIERVIDQLETARAALAKEPRS
jgi:hypothetical protein